MRITYLRFPRFQNFLCTSIHSYCYDSCHLPPVYYYHGTPVHILLPPTGWSDVQHTTHELPRGLSMGQDLFSSWTLLKLPALQTN